MNFVVRQAKELDAPASAEVVTRSIIQLCGADHGDDDVQIDAWLENKTAHNFARWITDRGNYCVVACSGTSIVGFGAMTNKGMLTLCYVDPGVRFLGVSSAILTALEENGRRLNLLEMRLRAPRRQGDFTSVEDIQSCLSRAPYRIGRHAFS